MFATSLALIAQEFQGRERATAFGIWGATVGGAVAIGPLVGGVLTEALRLGVDLLRQRPDRDRGDRPHAERRSPSRAPRTPSRSTGPAPCTFSSALFLLVFGLVRGNAEGWTQRPDPRLADRLGGAARRVRRRSSCAPTTRCSTSALFRKPAFVGVSAVAFCLSAGMFAMFLYLTIYMQGVLGYSAARGGRCASCR